MQDRTYRLNTPTLAIHLENGKHTPLTIPPGATVTVDDGPLDGTRLIDVKWQQKMVMMFAIDLRDRGTRIDQDQCSERSQQREV
jgi:hypothetical protein